MQLASNLMAFLSAESHAVPFSLSSGCRSCLVSALQMSTELSPRDLGRRMHHARHLAQPVIPCIPDPEAVPSINITCTETDIV